MSTPAQELGFKIGNRYIVAKLSDWTHCVPVGAEVEFARDDGTAEPYFLVVTDGGGNITSYLPLRDLTPVPTAAVSISVRIEQGCTMFIVGRVLTLAERTAVFNLLSSQGA
jgi:hypothetical protein